MKIDLTTLVLALVFACGLLAIDSVTACGTGIFAESPIYAGSKTS